MTLADAVTWGRIAFSGALLLCPVFSVPFWAVYLAAGVSDMIDGPIARRTGTASERGARLDTAADLAFFAACLIRLLPALGLPGWVFIWAAVIALIKGINVVSGFVMRKKLVTLHTALNRVTGALLFALPTTVTFIDIKYSAAAVCALATIAAVQEGHLIRTEER